MPKFFSRDTLGRFVATTAKRGKVGNAANAGGALGWGLGVLAGADAAARIRRKVNKKSKKARPLRNLAITGAGLLVGGAIGKRSGKQVGAVVRRNLPRFAVAARNAGRKAKGKAPKNYRSGTRVTRTINI